MRAPAPPRPANTNGSRKTNFIADNRRAVNAALSPCLVFAYWVLWKIMLVPIWGKLSMNTYIALLPMPLIILVAGYPSSGRHCAGSSETPTVSCSITAEDNTPTNPGH